MATVTPSKMLLGKSYFRYRVLPDEQDVCDGGDGWWSKGSLVLGFLTLNISTKIIINILLLYKVQCLSQVGRLLYKYDEY